MHRVLFYIGHYPIYSFGVMVALGCLVASCVSARESWRLRINRDDALEVCVWTVAFAVLGARLGFVVQDLPRFVAHPAEILNFREGGMTWHGSIVGIILGVWIPTRRMKIRLLDFLDLLAPGIILGLGIGRMGCFLNGCCYGKACGLPWAIVMPTDDNPGVFLARHPTQLYEMGLAFLAYPILRRWFHHRSFRGETFLAFLFVYSIVRGFVEFFREGALLAGTPLTLAQWVSVGLIVVSAMWLIAGRRRANRSRPPAASSERSGEDPA